MGVFEVQILSNYVVASHVKQRFQQQYNRYGLLLRPSIPLLLLYIFNAKVKVCFVWIITWVREKPSVLLVCLFCVVSFAWFTSWLSSKQSNRICDYSFAQYSRPLNDQSKTDEMKQLDFCVVCERIFNINQIPFMLCFISQKCSQNIA